MENKRGFTRRKCVKASAAVMTASFVARPGLASGARTQARESESVPHRPLEKTGALVSCLGVGGYHLGSIKEEKDSIELVARALDAGINFFDNCWEYHDGVSEERLGLALKGKRDKAFVMTKVCTHGRGKDVALKQLEESLKRLQTDHLDLWQVHEVVYSNDPELIHARGGVIEALDRAKKDGKVKYVGFTGHKDPSIHVRMIKLGYQWDSVQMPLNPFDGTYRSFERQVLPE